MSHNGTFVEAMLAVGKSVGKEDWFLGQFRLAWTTVVWCRTPEQLDEKTAVVRAKENRISLLKVDIVSNIDGLPDGFALFAPRGTRKGGLRRGQSLWIRVGTDQSAAEWSVALNKASLIAAEAEAAGGMEPTDIDVVTPEFTPIQMNKGRGSKPLNAYNMALKAKVGSTTDAMSPDAVSPKASRVMAIQRHLEVMNGEAEEEQGEEDGGDVGVDAHVATGAGAAAPSVLATSPPEVELPRHFLAQLVDHPSRQSFCASLLRETHDPDNLGDDEDLDAADASEASMAAPPTGLFQPGQVCKARFYGDQEWYMSRVDHVTGDGYMVVFTEYGNWQETLEHDLQAVPEDEARQALKGSAANVIIEWTPALLNVSKTLVHMGWFNGEIAIVQAHSLWWRRVGSAEPRVIYLTKVEHQPNVDGLDDGFALRAPTSTSKGGLRRGESLFIRMSSLEEAAEWGLSVSRALMLAKGLESVHRRGSRMKARLARKLKALRSTFDGSRSPKAPASPRSPVPSHELSGDDHEADTAPERGGDPVQSASPASVDPDLPVEACHGVRGAASDTSDAEEVSADESCASEPVGPVATTKEAEATHESQADPSPPAEAVRVDESTSDDPSNGPNSVDVSELMQSDSNASSRGRGTTVFWTQMEQEARALEVLEAPAGCGGDTEDTSASQSSPVTPQAALDFPDLESYDVSSDASVDAWLPGARSVLAPGTRRKVVNVAQVGEVAQVDDADAAAPEPDAPTGAAVMATSPPKLPPKPSRGRRDSALTGDATAAPSPAAESVDTVAPVAESSPEDDPDASMHSGHPPKPPPKPTMNPIAPASPPPLPTRRIS